MFENFELTIIRNIKYRTSGITHSCIGKLKDTYRQTVDCRQKSEKQNKFDMWMEV